MCTCVWAVSSGTPPRRGWVLGPWTGLAHVTRVQTLDVSARVPTCASWHSVCEQGKSPPPLLHIPAARALRAGMRHVPAVGMELHIWAWSPGAAAVSQGTAQPPTRGLARAHPFSQARSGSQQPDCWTPAPSGPEDPCPGLSPARHGPCQPAQTQAGHRRASPSYPGRAGRGPGARRHGRGAEPGSRCSPPSTP